MTELTVNSDTIANKIYFIRGHKVMLDRDLAELYAVQTKVLNQAVKRNSERFPDDFMFSLTQNEWESLRSQIVTIDTSKGQHTKYLPHVFTEHGILQLSNVLKSKQAIDVSIQIIRVFNKLRSMLEAHKDLRDKINQMERRYDQQFKVVFEAIRHILSPDSKGNPIGFLQSRDDK